jgi:serine/threonine protein kinase
MLGDLIAGRYRVEAELGRGGMGVVLRAHDTRLHRTVAVKMLRADAAQSDLLRQRLAAEALIASALNHPGIAIVHDFIEQAEAAYIIYEFVPGRTLRRHLESERFNFSETLDAALQLTEALTAAHEGGITHRDLKPENIMVTPDASGGRRMKILDFGLAKTLQQPCHLEASALTQTMSAQTAPDVRLGTIAYMAPEQLEGGRADARTDIYSLGLVIYEMAAGIHPFRGATLAATIANALATTAPPPSRHNSTLPAEFDYAVLKCLRKSPADRFQSSREISVDLRHITQDLNSASSHAVPVHTGHGIFRRTFSQILRHGWEVLHVRMCGWCGLLGYATWRFRLATPGDLGLAVFFAALVCMTVLCLLLVTVLYTHFTDDDRLAAEVNRMAPWVRVFSVMIGLLAWVMAIMVAANHTFLALFLTVMGTTFGVTVLTFKPAMDRGILSSKDLTRTNP